MNPPRLVLWDWNGTLLDDLDLCIQCLNQLLERWGYAQRYDLNQYRSIFGFPVRDYYRTAGFDFDRHPFDVLAQDYMEHYLPAAQQCGLCAGALQALTALKAAGIPQVVLSASPQSVLEEQVAQRGLSGFFDKLLGQNDIYAHSKVETGLRFMATQSIDPAQVVMIGDTLHDFETAQAMGTQCVLCAQGHHSTQRLQTTGAPVLQTLSLLPGMLGL